MNLLEGKTAIITGGTRGIGFGIAKKFLENGANVAVCGSRQSSVDKALAEFAELGYTDAVMGIVPDLSDPASIDDRVRQGRGALRASRHPGQQRRCELAHPHGRLRGRGVPQGHGAQRRRRLFLQPGGCEDLPCPGQRRLDS